MKRSARIRHREILLLGDTGDTITPTVAEFGLNWEAKTSNDRFDGVAIDLGREEALLDNGEDAFNRWKYLELYYCQLGYSLHTGSRKKKVGQVGASKRYTHTLRWSNAFAAQIEPNWLNHNKRLLWQDPPRITLRGPQLERFHEWSQ